MSREAVSRVQRDLPDDIDQVVVTKPTTMPKPFFNSQHLVIHYPSEN
ncbi:MAG: hypothetical protein ACOH5I_21400 [Oligoflexus sp.]